jgi:hypothetical protein
MICGHCRVMFENKNYCPVCGFIGADRVREFIHETPDIYRLAYTYTRTFGPDRLAEFNKLPQKNLLENVANLLLSIAEEAPGIYYHALVGAIQYHKRHDYIRWMNKCAGHFVERTECLVSFPWYAWNLGISPHLIAEALTKCVTIEELNQFLFSQPLFQKLGKELCGNVDQTVVVWHMIDQSTRETLDKRERLTVLFEFIQTKSGNWSRFDRINAQNLIIFQ